jgi:hypothetical protein
MEDLGVSHDAIADEMSFVEMDHTQFDARSETDINPAAGASFLSSLSSSSSPSASKEQLHIDETNNFPSLLPSTAAENYPSSLPSTIPSETTEKGEEEGSESSEEEIEEEKAMQRRASRRDLQKKKEKKQDETVTIRGRNETSEEGGSTDEGNGDGDGEGEGEGEGDETYCICRGRDDGRPMICCDTCSEWYHAKCLKLTKKKLDLLKVTSFICPRCDPNSLASIQGNLLVHVHVLDLLLHPSFISFSFSFSFFLFSFLLLLSFS